MYPSDAILLRCNGLKPDAALPSLGELTGIAGAYALRVNREKDTGEVYVWLDLAGRREVSAELVGQLEAAARRLLPGATLDAVPLKRMQYIEGASSGQPIGIFYMVEMEYPPEALPQMTHWYHFEHLPGLCSVKGNVRSTRYLSEAGRSFACYDLVSEDVPQTAEWSQWRETALTVSVRPFYRNMKRGLYRATKI
jgi:hypothetical protein